MRHRDDILLGWVLRHEHLEPQEARREIESQARQSRQTSAGQAPGRLAVVALRREVLFLEWRFDLWHGQNAMMALTYRGAHTSRQKEAVKKIENGRLRVL